MTHSTTQPYGVPVICLVAVAGCGDPIATGSYRPPYVTLSGTLQVQTMLKDQVSLALLWQNRGGGASHSTTLLEEPIEGPASFVVGISEKPPAAALLALPAEAAAGDMNLDPAMRYAVATLVVYHDDDHDGQLNLVGPDGGPSADRILGVASDYDLFFLAQGRPATSQWLGIFPTATGFSLVHEPALRDPLPYDCDEVGADSVTPKLCHMFEVGAPAAISVDTPLDITLSGEAPLQRFACDTFWGDHHYPDWEADASLGCFGNCPLDLPPAGAAVHCSGDGNAYVYQTCHDDAALCGTTICHFGHGARVAGSPPPAGWPCS